MNAQTGYELTPAKLAARTASTISEITTYVQSRCVSNAATASATRATGVAINSSSPS